MRSALLVLSLTFLVPACASTPLEATETGTSEDSGSGGADGATSGESSGASSSTGSEATDSGAEWTGGDGDGDTTGGGDGDGDTTGGGDGDGDTTTTATTTGDGDGDTTGTTTGSGSDCSMTITEEIDADEAVLMGEWMGGNSQLAPEEGYVVYPLDYGASGSATFALDFPCDDDWHVWVKGLDRNTDDSFFVQVDGSPNPSAIFDIDCAEGNFNGSYEWEHLNERPDGEFCGEPYPWVISGGGSHELTFFEREAGAISAIAFSNDPGYTPNF